MTLYVEDEWSGWDGETVVRLTDGSVWRQDEYYYEYRYAYRRKVHISHRKMQVEGMNRAVRVTQL
jgi:CRISPR/Cas system-associated exonuclease Cas4 (RecB family)